MMPWNDMKLKLKFGVLRVNQFRSTEWKLQNQHFSGTIVRRVGIGVTSQISGSGGDPPSLRTEENSDIFW